MRVAGLRRARRENGNSPPYEPLWRLLGGANVVDAPKGAMRYAGVADVGNLNCDDMFWLRWHAAR